MPIGDRVEQADRTRITGRVRHEPAGPDDPERVGDGDGDLMYDGVLRGLARPRSLQSRKCAGPDEGAVRGIDEPEGQRRRAVPVVSRIASETVLAPTWRPRRVAGGRGL